MSKFREIIAYPRFIFSSILADKCSTESWPIFKSSLNSPRRRQGQGTGLGLERHSVVSANPKASDVIKDQHVVDQASR